MTISFQRLSKAFVLLSLAYVIINLFIIVFMDRSASFRLAADGGSWFIPAQSLLHSGSLSSPDHPGLEIYRSPAVAVIFAGLMYLAGGESVSAIVAGQICALYVTAVLFRATVKDWFPRYADLGMALILFNPSLLAMAYFTQSETFATLTAMIALFFLLRYTKGHTSWPVVLGLGLSLGVTCLVRTNPIYLVYLLPLVLPVIGMIERHAISWRLAVAKGAIAMCLAIAVMSPWIINVYEKSGHIGLSTLISSRAEFEYFYDQLTILEAAHSNISTHDAKIKLDSGPREAFVQSFGSKWVGMSETERFVLLRDFTLKTMLGYPLRDWTTALGLSMAQFYFGGGSGAWHNLFGTFAGGMVRSFSETPKTDVVAFLRNAILMAPYGALALSAMCFAFIAVVRTALVFGFVELCRRRLWGLLLILSGTSLYFGLSTLFQGQARYRASIEPELMLMAVAGFALIWEWLRKSRSQAVPR